MGGYAIELSIAVTGTNIDFDNYPQWQTANEWLVDAAMEAVFANTGTVSSREFLYRKGLVTAASGDEFYHYELRIVAQETDDGYVVIQYLLNLLNV